MNRLETIEPVDLTDLQKTKYKTLSDLLCVFTSINRHIKMIEENVISLPRNTKADKYISEYNKLMITEEMDHRAAMLPDWYLDEAKQLINPKNPQ